MSFGLKREREKRRNPVGREDKRIFLNDMLLPLFRPSGLFCNIFETAFLRMCSILFL